VLKFQWVTPNGVQNTQGAQKFVSFDKKTHYISNTVQDIGIFSIKGEQKVVRAVLNNDIADDLVCSNHPKSATFYVLDFLHIS